MTTPRDNSAASLRARAERAAAKWVNEHDIEEQVRQGLDRLSDDVALATFGMERRFGRVGFSVSRDGSIGAAMLARAEEVAREWVRDNAPRLPSLSAKDRAALRRAYLDRLYQAVECALIGLAEERADDIAREVAATWDSDRSNAKGGAA